MNTKQESQRKASLSMLFAAIILIAIGLTMSGCQSTSKKVTCPEEYYENGNIKIKETVTLEETSEGWPSHFFSDGAGKTINMPLSHPSVNGVGGK